MQFDLLLKSFSYFLAEKSGKKSKKKKRVVDPAFLLWEIQKAMVMTFSFLADFAPLSESKLLLDVLSFLTR